MSMNPTMQQQCNKLQDQLSNILMDNFKNGLMLINDAVLKFAKDNALAFETAKDFELLQQTIVQSFKHFEMNFDDEVIKFTNNKK